MNYTALVNQFLVMNNIYNLKNNLLNQLKGKLIIRTIINPRLNNVLENIKNNDIKLKNKLFYDSIIIIFFMLDLPSE